MQRNNSQPVCTACGSYLAGTQVMGFRPQARCPACQGGASERRPAQRARVETGSRPWKWLKRRLRQDKGVTLPDMPIWG